MGKAWLNPRFSVRGAGAHQGTPGDAGEACGCRSVRGTREWHPVGGDPAAAGRPTATGTALLQTTRQPQRPAEPGVSPGGQPLAKGLSNAALYFYLFFKFVFSS